jgi:hypothetical protein
MTNVVDKDELIRVLLKQLRSAHFVATLATKDAGGAFATEVSEVELPAIRRAIKFAEDMGY